MKKSFSIHIILIVSALFYIALAISTSFKINGKRYYTLVDDAMISMQYAKHLAQGHGLVWNIGEAPTEGFTNLGWTLYMALLHLFPFSSSTISLAVTFTSLTALLINIALIYKIAQAITPNSNYAPTLAAFITAFCFPLVFWSLRGMEVGLVTLLINSGLLLAITTSPEKKSRNSIAISVILSIAILTRMDTLISSAIIVLYLFNKDKRSAVIPAISIIVTTLAIFYFQKIYFGDFLPTTYYQKITGFSAFERILRGSLVFVQYTTRDALLFFLVSLASIYFYKMQHNSEVLILLGIFIAQCIYSITIGGDYAEAETNTANRFITQGIPVLIVLFSWMTSRILIDLKTAQPQFALSISKINPAIPIAIMTILITSSQPWATYLVDNAPLLKADVRRVKIGLLIAENTTPDAVIAVHAAGQIPYFSERTTIDLLGLNDPIVAKSKSHGDFYPGHNKWDYKYSITQLQPDLIADNFAPLTDFMNGNKQYTKLANGMYVRVDSLLVDSVNLVLQDKR